MKTKKSFIFFAVLILVAGCSKGPPFDGAKIYTVYSVKANYTTTYTYNADGTVSTIVQSTDGVNIGHITFQYNGNNVLQDNYNLGNIISSAISYTENSASLAHTGQGEYTLANHAYAYAYDDNSQLTSKANYILGALQSTLTYSSVNKNLYEIDSLDVGSGLHYYDYFNYLSSNSNSIGVQNQGEYFLGASSANLVLTDVKLNNTLDTTDIISYRYRYDGSGYVDTIAVYNRAGVQLDSAFYTYY